jgi:hypothetical protein
MIKYCPNCGTKRNATDLFCKNCGQKIKQNKKEIQQFEKQIAYPQQNKPYINKYYIQTNQPKNQNKRKILAGTILTVIIAMMLISTAFFIQPQTDTKKQDQTEPEDPKIPEKPEKLDPVEFGPKVSLQSLTSGTVTSIPQENAKAKYGLYDQNGILGKPGQRIGEINEENLGKVTFQGEQCILVKTEGRIIIPMDEYLESYRSMSTTQQEQEILNQIPNQISYYIYSDYYIKQNDNTPIYMDYKIDFTEFFEILKEISIASGNTEQTDYLEFDEVMIGFIIDWDREGSKADMRMYMEGFSFMNMDANFTVEFSEEYWDMCPEFDELYVGFEKIMNFTMTLKMNDFSYSFEEYEEEYETEEVMVSSSNSQEIEEHEYSNSQSDLYEDDSEDYTSSVENIMKFNVVNQEDLFLDCGNFTDCYVIEIEQNQISSYDYNYGSSSTTSTKIWINENGVMPKAEYTFLGNSGMTSSDSQKLLMILEEYIK